MVQDKWFELIKATVPRNLMACMYFLDLKMQCQLATEKIIKLDNKNWKVQQIQPV